MDDEIDEAFENAKHGTAYGLDEKTGEVTSFVHDGKGMKFFNLPSFVKPKSTLFTKQTIQLSSRSGWNPFWKPTFTLRRIHPFPTVVELKEVKPK
jgi:hypothetical protein